MFRCGLGWNTIILTKYANALRNLYVYEENKERLLQDIQNSKSLK